MFLSSRCIAAVIFAGFALSALAQSPVPPPQDIPAPPLEVRVDVTDSASRRLRTDISPFTFGNDRFSSVPSMKSIALTTAITTGLFVPFDRQITGHARSMSATGNSPIGTTASVLNWIGGPGSVALPLTLATVGFVTRQPAIKDMGFHATESVLLSAGVTTALKGVVGRTRPAAKVLDADDFTFQAGFRRNTATSFPSGHTTAAFALATTLTLETARAYPRAKWLVGLSSFGVASGVGLARVYTDRHWSSDVIVGAGIGTLTGVLVDRVVHSDAEEHHRWLGWLR